MFRAIPNISWKKHPTKCRPMASAWIDALFYKVHMHNIKMKVNAHETTSSATGQIGSGSADRRVPSRVKGKV